MSVSFDLTLLTVGGALALRFGVLAATLPLLDLRAVPALWRLGLAACFAGALAPAVAAGIPPGSVELTWKTLVAEGVRSLAIGAMLGFAVNLVFTAVRMAGAIVGMQVGFSIVNAFDPITNSEQTAISQLYYLLAVLLFFTTGGHLMMVGAMFQSCLAVPPFAPFDPAGGSWYLLEQFGRVFTLGLRIAAPVVLVLLLVSSAMGVIVKTVPQLNILAVGFPVKIAVGLIVLGLSLVYFREIAEGLFLGLEDEFDRVLLALQ